MAAKPRKPTIAELAAELGECRDLLSAIIGQGALKHVAHIADGGDALRLECHERIAAARALLAAVPAPKINGSSSVPVGAYDPADPGYVHISGLAPAAVAHVSDREIFEHYKQTAPRCDYVWFLGFAMSDTLRAYAASVGPAPAAKVMHVLRARWRAERMRAEKIERAQRPLIELIARGVAMGYGLGLDPGRLPE